MAVVLSNYVKEMAQEELRMVLGVSGGIRKLHRHVEILSQYLYEAEKRRIDNPRVQGWVTKLNGVYYEATDILELCQLEVEERRDSAVNCWTTMEEKAPGFLRPLLFCLRNPGFAYTMGKRIKDLNASLEVIRSDMREFQFVAIDPYMVDRAPSEATSNSRTTTSLPDRSAIVGNTIEADTHNLVQLLIGGPQQPQGDDEQTLMVLSIVGAGGIGKTTLAQEIFNHKTIQAEFSSKIWLSVTKICNPKELLSSAIAQASRRPDMMQLNNYNVQVQNLAIDLAETLSSLKGKFLMVLDDIWTHNPWTDVLRSPVVEAGLKSHGSRLIITTRNEDLAGHMEVTYHQHHARLMSDGDAWSLLKKQLLPKDIDHLRHIGMEIIRKCDGLPLAVKAIAGLLRTKRATEQGWNIVLDDPAWRTTGTHADLNNALRLSYEGLSAELKQCFLCFSLFPKEVIVPYDVLIGMWMSEGYLKVSPNNEGSMRDEEDIGMDFYSELITRNLIEPKENYVDGWVCKIHDVICSFAHYMAKEEAVIIRPGPISPNVSLKKFRRLSVQDWSSIPQDQQLLRTLIISGGKELDVRDCVQEIKQVLISLLTNGRMRYEPSTSENVDTSSSQIEPSTTASSLSRFPALRALFVSHVELDRFVESLGTLRHLRFLHLDGTDISKLPDDIDKMKFLEHIHMANCSRFGGQFPKSIVRLQRLRYLYIGQGTKFLVPKGLGGLTNLRRLAKFPVQIDGEWCSLQELGPLHKLRSLELQFLESVSPCSLAAEAKIRDKRQIRVLFLSCSKSVRPMVAQEACRRLEEVYDQLCPPPLIEHLQIENYIGSRVPSWMCMPTAVDFNSLRLLVMTNLSFCTKLPDGLCRLPSLENLKINIAPAVKHVGPEFQVATRGGGRVAKPAFPMLQCLTLDVLPNWVDWEWGAEEASGTNIAMPALETIGIRKCGLDCLPAGLASSRRNALRKLWLQDLSKITSVENFPSVVVLVVTCCPLLTVIRGFPRVQDISIQFCGELKVLEAGPALGTLELKDPSMKTLPEYLRGLNPRILQVLRCHPSLRNKLLSDESSADYRAEMAKVTCGKFAML